MLESFIHFIVTLPKINKLIIFSHQIIYFRFVLWEFLINLMLLNLKALQRQRFHHSTSINKYLSDSYLTVCLADFIFRSDYFICSWSLLAYSFIVASLFIWSLFKSPKIDDLTCSANPPTADLIWMSLTFWFRLLLTVSKLAVVSLLWVLTYVYRLAIFLLVSPK